MIDLIVYLITSLIDWVNEKDLYYKPYRSTVIGEHYEEKRGRNI